MSEYNVLWIIAPVEFGTLVSAILLGCTVLQTYFYHCNFGDDTTKKKALVTAALLLNFFHFLTIAAILWKLTISYFGQEVASIPNPELCMLGLCTEIMNILMQGFYAFRLQRLSKRRYLPLFVALATTVCLSVTLYCSIGTLMFSGSTSQWFALHGWTVIAGTAFEVAGSLAITGGTTWYLFKSKNWALRDTMRQIDQLILWTIEIGLGPCICRIALMICLLRWRDTLYWIGPYIMTTGVQANCLLAALNSRMLFRRNSSIIFCTSGTPTSAGAGGRSDPMVVFASHTIRSNATDDDKTPLPETISLGDGAS